MQIKQIDLTPSEFTILARKFQGNLKISLPKVIK